MEIETGDVHLEDENADVSPCPGFCSGPCVIAEGVLNRDELLYQGQTWVDGYKSFGLIIVVCFVGVYLYVQASGIHGVLDIVSMVCMAWVGLFSLYRAVFYIQHTKKRLEHLGYTQHLTRWHFDEFGFGMRSIINSPILPENIGEIRQYQQWDKVASIERDGEKLVIDSGVYGKMCVPIRFFKDTQEIETVSLWWEQALGTQDLLFALEYEGVVIQEDAMVWEISGEVDAEQMARLRCEASENSGWNYKLSRKWELIAVLPMIVICSWLSGYVSVLSGFGHWATLGWVLAAVFVIGGLAIIVRRHEGGGRNGPLKDDVRLLMREWKKEVTKVQVAITRDEILYQVDGKIVVKPLAFLGMYRALPAGLVIYRGDEDADKKSDGGPELEVVIPYELFGCQENYLEAIDTIHRMIGRCDACDYLLENSQEDACPECGAEIVAQPIAGHRQWLKNKTGGPFAQPMV